MHQYRAKGSPTNTLAALWCICIFPTFPLKTSFLVYTKPRFFPVEALEFLELKTPLVYTFFLRQVGAGDPKLAVKRGGHIPQPAWGGANLKMLNSWSIIECLKQYLFTELSQLKALLHRRII